MIDGHVNFGYSTLASGVGSAATSLTVHTGDGALFAGTPVNAVLAPNGSTPLSTNAEIVRVTARAGDVLTITRGQEGTTQRAFNTGDVIFIAPTAKTHTDAERAFSNDAALLQNGIINSGDLAVSAISVNGSTGAITLTIAAAQPVWIKDASGILVPAYLASQTVTKSLGSAPASGQTSAYLFAIDTSGAVTIDVVVSVGAGNIAIPVTNAIFTQAAASGRLPLAVVGVANVAGTYQLCSTSSPTQGTNWFDRRPWARGASAFISGSTSGPTTTSTSNTSLADMVVRLECTGAPIQVLFSGDFSNNGADNYMQLNLFEDGSAVIGPTRTNASHIANQRAVIAMTWDRVPAAGSHLYEIRWQTSAGTATALGTTRQMSVMEKLRVNANNGVA